MRLLHISDFHLKTPIGSTNENTLQKFLGFIADNAKEIQFDHIVITGDIRNFNESEDLIEISQVINNIVKAARIKETKRIHIVPGNHDLRRCATDNETMDQIRKEYDYDRGVFSNYHVCLPKMLNRFNDFFWPLCEEIYGSKNSPWNNRCNNPHALVIDQGIGFVYINSCLTCIDRARDGDLVIGLNYLHQYMSKLNDIEIVFFLSHHPMQNLTNREEMGFEQFIKGIKNKKIFWLCGDAHNNRKHSRDYIILYQVGSLTGSSDAFPDFAIYDIDKEYNVERRVYRFLMHLNSLSSNPGGWKRVYIDPKSSSLYSEKLEDDE